MEWAAFQRQSGLEQYLGPAETFREERCTAGKVFIAHGAEGFERIGPYEQGVLVFAEGGGGQQFHGLYAAQGLDGAGKVFKLSLLHL